MRCKKRENIWKEFIHGAEIEKQKGRGNDKKINRKRKGNKQNTERKGIERGKKRTRWRDE